MTLSPNRLSLLTAQRERVGPVTILATAGSPDYGAAQLLVQTETGQLNFIRTTPQLIRRLVEAMRRYGKLHPTGLRLGLRELSVGRPGLGIPVWDVLPYRKGDPVGMEG